jgi:hypothetical protein
MSAGEEVVRKQLDQIIARIELRVERHCARASVLARYGSTASRSCCRV